MKEPKEVLPPLPRPESKVQEVSPEVVRTPKSSGKPELPPPPARPKPSLGKRLESRAVNALFNEAKQSGLVAGWQDYERLIRKVLGGEVKSPYHLSPEEWARFESWVRPRQKAAKVA